MNPFIMASLLGFKHALDPDHIAATLNMTLSGRVRGLSAARLGLSWGIGHATSMAVLGLPVVLLSASFPLWVYTSAELLIGLIILYLGLKLFVQWFMGKFHPHEILKIKERGDNHTKTHRKASLMGLLHGVGGSYPAALLMIASFSNPVSAAIGLVSFVVLSIFSMALTTLLFSLSTFHHSMMHVLDRLLIPTFIVITVLFSINYIKEALNGLGII